MKRLIFAPAAVAFLICFAAHLRAEDQQDPKDNQPPAAATQPAKKPHPHLIELTSRNWHPLKPGEKFELFWRDMISWETHLSLAADAAISFATDDRDYLGTGAKGYAKRYGINVLDEANSTFIQAFLLPTVFHEEPRYIPYPEGTKKQRVAYAIESVVIARKDSGGIGLNKSKLIGELASTSISYIYNAPVGRNTEFSATLTATAINLGTDAAFNLFKEFWPDFARKVKLNVWLRNIVRSTIRDVIRVD